MALDANTCALGILQLLTSSGLTDYRHTSFDPVYQKGLGGLSSFAYVVSKAVDGIKESTVVTTINSGQAGVGVGTGVLFVPGGSVAEYTLFVEARTGFSGAFFSTFALAFSSGIWNHLLNFAEIYSGVVSGVGSGVGVALPGSMVCSYTGILSKMYNAGIELGWSTTAPYNQWLVIVDSVAKMCENLIIRSSGATTITGTTSHGTASGIIDTDGVLL
jgi:hypothetical protein